MNAPTPEDRSSPILRERLVSEIGGYPAMVRPEEATAFVSITQDYAQAQVEDNTLKTDIWLHPLLQANGVRRVLDAGCGVGQMVARLNEKGYDAHGFDLTENVKHWQALARDPSRFVVVEPDNLVLPYATASFDAVVSFGVIEHVGTTDGNADRRPDYHLIRRRWVQELLRVVKPGGFVLLCGPNRNFPVDTSHGPDSQALPVERWLYGKLGATIHRPWGPNFLWSYSDVQSYVGDTPVEIEGLSVEGLLYFSRVPFPLNRLGNLYIRLLPGFLLKTGFNPWVMAKIRKLASA